MAFAERLGEHFQQPYSQDFRNKVGNLAKRDEVYFAKPISVPAR